MTRRLSKSGNKVHIVPIIDKESPFCYNLDFYNKAGFLVARNPCLSEEDMKMQKKELEDRGYEIWD